jgi:D-glycero-D-manno-heptose 1,7-bisphosphate phosphatase
MGIYEMIPAVFLDRDGIINQAYVYANRPYPPACVNAIKLTKGIKELVGYLSKKYILIVLSNQPDVARGIQTWNEVRNITEFLHDQLPEIADYFYCFHDELDNCNCRKPKIGLFLEAAEMYDIDLDSSWMIGDRWSDVSAGHNAGCKIIFVDYKYDEKESPYIPDYTVNSILEIKNIFEKEEA